MTEHLLPELGQDATQQQNTEPGASTPPPLPPLQQEASYHEQALGWMQSLLEAVEDNKPDEAYIASDPDVYMQLGNIATASQHAASNLLACKHAIYMCAQFLMDWMPDDEEEQDDISLLIENSSPYQEAPQNIATIVEETTIPTPVATEGQSVALPGAAEQESPAPQENTIDSSETRKEEETLASLQDENAVIPVFVEAENAEDLPQIAIRTEALLKLINKVERTISNKTTRDIEKYIYFDFNEDRVIARTTNGHFMSEASLVNTKDTLNYQLIGQPSIEICFMGSMLIPMIKKITTDNILITYNRSNNLATIDSGNSEMIINFEEGGQFDLPPRLDGQCSTVLLPIDHVSHMYQGTVYAISEKSPRSSIMGLHHEISKDQLRFTATDGYRLARQSLSIDLAEEIGEELSCIVPRETISEILKMMNSSEDEYIELRIGDKRMEYTLSDVKMYSRLIDADYPNIDRMINEDMESYIDVPHKVLKEALMFTGMFEEQGDKKMLLLIKPKAEDGLGQLRIATPATEKGKYTQDAVIQGEGVEMTMQINFKYLSDALKKYTDTSTIRLSYMKHNAPLLIKEVNQGEGCLDVLLPIVSAQAGMHADIKKFKARNEFKAFKTSLFDGME